MARTTPLARAVARDLGVDLDAVAGSGRGGRILRADVEAAAAQAPAAPPAPAPGPPAARAATAVPHVHLTVAVDAEALLELQDDLNRQRAAGGDDLEVTVRDLVAEACAMLLRADPALNVSFGGDAFTVSHLNVDQFRALIDPPAAAVLGFGAVLPEPVATGDGGVAVRRRMRLTLSIDHRVLDGATGARFLGQLKTALEHPLQIVA